jgi:hypothetical protein
MNDRSSLEHDLSLTKGGPYYRTLVRLRLLRPDSYSVRRRAILFVLLTWLPLLLLSAFQGLALGGALRIPFLRDFPISVRFLLALPLLIAAESVVDSRVALVVRYLTQSGLVQEEDYPGYGSAARQISRMCNSRLAEGVIAGIIILSAALPRFEFSGAISTWQFIVSPLGAMRTAAGWWYVFVSLPVFQFLFYRWCWRYFIWCWFLWRISRLDLQLIPTHPDLAAGLGCLGLAQTKFWIIIFAISSVFSSHLGEEILYAGASLAGYKIMFLIFLLLIFVIFLGPLLVFTPKLFEAKRRGLLDYGVLANKYTRSFHRRWIKRKAHEVLEEETLVESADIQLLTSLRGSFELVHKMRFVPFDLVTTVVPIVASAAIPLAPLTLTVIPLEEIIKRFLKIWF